MASVRFWISSGLSPVTQAVANAREPYAREHRSGRDTIRRCPCLRPLLSPRPPPPRAALPWLRRIKPRRAADRPSPSSLRGRATPTHSFVAATTAKTSGRAQAPRLWALAMRMRWRPQHHAATTCTPAARGAVAQPSLPLAGPPTSPSIRRPPRLMELRVVLEGRAPVSFLGIRTFDAWLTAWASWINRHRCSLLAEFVILLHTPASMFDEMGKGMYSFAYC